MFVQFVRTRVWSISSWSAQSHADLKLRHNLIIFIQNILGAWASKSLGISCLSSVTSQSRCPWFGQRLYLVTPPPSSSIRSGPAYANTATGTWPCINARVTTNFILESRTDMTLCVRLLHIPSCDLTTRPACVFFSATNFKQDVELEPRRVVPGTRVHWYDYLTTGSISVDNEPISFP